MLWLALIRKRGLDVTTAEYLRVALVTTPIVLVGGDAGAVGDAAMTAATALICLDGYRVAAALDAAATALNPALTWILLFVSDTRPGEELAHALERLPARGPGRLRAEARMRHVVEWSEEDVRATTGDWLTARSAPPRWWCGAAARSRRTCAWRRSARWR